MPRKCIPWTSTKSACCQQGPPVSLDRASHPPPDARMHACINAVVPFSPRPSHGCPAQPHGRSRASLPSRSLSRPPRRIARPSPSHLPSPRPLPRTSNSDVATTTTRRSCCRDRHTVVVTARPPRLGLPSPRARNSDAVTTMTRRSFCRDRHAVVVTARPLRPGLPSPRARG